MQTTLVHLAVRLIVDSDELAPYIEELLWTLDTVESVTTLIKPDFKGIEVIGLGHEFARQVTSLLEEHELLGETRIHSTRQIQEEDWAESWKQHWKVSRILPDLVIQPSWEQYTHEPNETVLVLDPGQAFGTGTHETTQLMLLLIRDTLSLVPHGSVDSMLDVGCGSGILALYGAKLGIPTVLAQDIDPITLEVTHQNATINGVASQIETTKTPLPELSSSPFKLVSANILTKTLVELMPHLKQVLHPRGVLLLSGITVGQGSQILESLAIHKLAPRRIVQKKDWLAFACTHRDHYPQ